MKTVEAEGHTIDEAIENALRELGVDRSRAEIEILANASKGILGLGGKKARVRATLRPSLDEVAARASEAAPEAAPELAPGDSGEEVGRRARQVLLELLDKMGFSSEVAVEAGENGLCLQIRAESSGLLIGRHGQTLDAIEYFVRRIVARDFGERVSLNVDCERYRERRRKSIEEMAVQAVEQARKKGKPVSLVPMNARERRIVHLALQGIPDVTTRSTGEGEFRRVIVVPVKERSKGS
ncbi:MAG: single-stranded DNA-binding protein [Candidatus Binatia bacterium]|nr:MAG: single-stranded DNA-binding protein [Candidatus Binatia bacterium]